MRIMSNTQLRNEGKEKILSAAETYHHNEKEMLKARENLYATMRHYEYLFTQNELVELSGISRPSLYRHVLLEVS